jgi:catechol-2,3-dioxygenase
MSANVIKLGFLGVNVERHDEMAEHYGKVLGLPAAGDAKGETYFSCGSDAFAIGFHRGGPRGYRYLGFQIGGEGPLKDVEARMKELGIACAVKSDLFPGIPSCIEISDPDQYTLYLYRGSAAPKEAYPNSGIIPEKLGHVALYVGDANKTASYYEQVLGFRWSDWLEDFFVFMRCNADHHSMNFLRHEKRGIFHIAFELHDWGHIGRSCDVLAQHGVRLIWGPGRHGMGHNLFTYHRDPDDNIVELIADLDRISDERLGYFDPRPYHQEFPQRPKVWKRGGLASNMWGIEATPEFHR